MTWIIINLHTPLLTIYVHKPGCLFYVDVTAEEFFRASDGEESLYERLQRLLSEVLQTDLDKVHIFSLANGSHSTKQHLSLWFAAHGSPYYKPEKLHGNVAMHKAKVTTITHRETRAKTEFFTSLMHISTDSY